MNGIGGYRVLKGKSDGDKALDLLKRIGESVKHIMTKRQWTVGSLEEFYPKTKQLYGMNVNRGTKILIRLRHGDDVNSFLPLEQLCDTMLHELCHNEIGPHSVEFYKLWDELRSDFEKGNGLLGSQQAPAFEGKGKRLGGGVQRGGPLERRNALLVAAERRRVMSSNSTSGGNRLGGSVVKKSARERALEAAEARRAHLQTCRAIHHGVDLDEEAEKDVMEKRKVSSSSSSSKTVNVVSGPEVIELVSPSEAPSKKRKRLLIWECPECTLMMNDTDVCDACGYSKEGAKKRAAIDLTL